MKRKIVSIILEIAILGIGVLIGIFIPRFLSSSFPLINPAVTMNLDKHFVINFQPLKEKLVAVQKEYPQKTFIYFNYLNNASWIGLNEKDLFTAPAPLKFLW